MAEIASFPARTLAGDALAGDALLEMFAAGVHHVPVTEDGRVIGVVTDTDLMGAGQHSPFAIKSAIERSRSADEAVNATLDLSMVVAGLVDTNTDPVAIGRVVSLVLDAATERLVAHAISALGDPPASFAWLVLGSGARHEQALGTDQDHAIAFEPSADADLAVCDAYFAALAEAVTGGLERAGIPRCAGDAMAVNASAAEGWRGDFREVISVRTAGIAGVGQIGHRRRGRRRSCQS